MKKNRNRFATSLLTTLLSAIPLSTQASYQPQYNVQNQQTFFNNIENSVKPTQGSNLPGADGIAYMHDNHGEFNKDLPEPYRTFVNRHEVAHLLGSIDEYKTDLRAAAETGHIEFVRGPFYRPPLRSNYISFS